MKKFLMSLVIVATMASVAMAGVGIQWTTGYGGYTHTSPIITGFDNAILDSYSVIWQLVYSGTDGINPPSLATAGAGYVTGDDVVWATRTIAQGGGTGAEDGSTWNNFMYRADLSGSTTFENAAWATAGSVYQRVFEGTPAPGTYWYDSPLFTYDATWTDSQAAESFNTEVNMNVGGFHAPAGNFFPVPEPATMSLLGLGALVMAIRRRRS